MKSVSGLSAALSLLALSVSISASAQTGAIIQQTPSSPAVERLNQNLNRLSRAPTDMEALIGAGNASYELGDAQAANGFFTRANMVNGRDGRAKLGLALVSLALKQPVEAATYFDEADALGSRADQYLDERALAYDLTGQQEKAQRDYAVALQREPGNDQLARAYAVSLGISGKVDAAEAQLRPLLYKSDRAAWRDRTMILAMNGRTTEARKIAQTIMPRNLSDAMDPYLIRMGALTAAQKAAAVHYGQFPADGLRLAAVTSPPAAAQVTARAESGARDKHKGKAAAPVATASATGTDESRLLAAAPHGDMPPPAMVQPVPQPAAPVAARNSMAASAGASAGDDDPDGWTDAERRRAERRPARTLPAGPTQPVQPVQTAQAIPARPIPAPTVSPATIPAPAPTATPSPTPAPVRSAQAEPIRTGPVPSYATTAGRAGAMVQGPVDSGSTLTPTPAAPPPASPAPSAVQPAATATPPAPGFSAAPPEGTKPAAPQRTLAQIMAAIEVPESERARPPQLVDLNEVAQIQAAAKRKAAADKARKEAAAKAKAEADAKAKAEAEEKARIKANPSRIWAQVATGKDPAALAFDMRRLKKTYSSALSGEDAFTAEWGATHRLLVGPFATQAKAKAVLTDLKKAGGDGFVYQSEPGEVVTPLSGK